MTIRQSAGWVSLVCLAVWLGGPMTSNAKPGVSPAIRLGKALYIEKGCYTCHGRVAQGSIMTGPPLNPLRFPDQALIAFVRGHGGAMPPYSAAILSDAELTEIGAYLRAMPAPSPAARIPLLAPFVREH